MKPEDYGRFYYEVCDDDGYSVYLHADVFEIREGALIFWREIGDEERPLRLNALFAAGKWRHVHAVSAIDGSRCCVEHEVGTVIPDRRPVAPATSPRTR